MLTMHIGLAILGALAGLVLAGIGHGPLAAVIGACVGLGIAEAMRTAARLSALERELERLREQPRTEASSALPHPLPRHNPVPPVRVFAAQIAPSLEPPPSAFESAALQPAAPAPLPARPLSIVQGLQRFFTGGNALVRIGVIVLFFGVGFLLRYLAEHTHISIALRLCGVVLGALVLLGLGWRLRTHRSGYALALQGGAIGILYLTVFAALRLYSLLSPAPAFALLVVLAALSATLAVLQNSQAFALLAVTGGFLAPILASPTHGDHVVLFGYYALLNAAILAIAWFKAWRPLNLVGFAFTLLIATAWGVLRYRPEDFATTEPFLIVFFVFYAAMAILLVQRQAPELRGYIDGPLVFGMPIAVLSLQAAMLHGHLLPMADSALAMSGTYLVLSWALYWRGSAAQRLLAEAFLAVGIMFVTLAVPLALDRHWTAISWALEGAALIWIGCRQHRAVARAFGGLLQIAAGCMIALRLSVVHAHLYLPPGLFLTGLLVGVACIYAAYVLDAARQRLAQQERVLGAMLFFWGLIWWCVSGIAELQHMLPPRWVFTALLCFLTLTALLSSELCQRLKFSIARVPALLLLPVMLLFAIVAFATFQHPLANEGWICWPLASAAFYVVASRHEGPPAGSVAILLHTVSLWLLAALSSWELAWQVTHSLSVTGSWPGIAWAVPPALLLFVLPWLTMQLRWPFALHRATYLELAASGFATYLGLWSLAANVWMCPDAYPLPYIPVLNPLDLAQALVLLALVTHFVRMRREHWEVLLTHERAILGTLAALIFVALNATLLRALHHWVGIPYALGPMLQSTLVQTSLSIFWAVLALTTMLLATRTGNRTLWLTGAGLLAVVVIKLFLIDLSSIGTIDRIISFVGVGLLMLVLGYFSPLPPVARSPP